MSRVTRLGVGIAAVAGIAASVAFIRPDSSGMIVGVHVARPHGVRPE